MTGPQISGGIEAAGIIRKMKPEIPIIWGGVHPSLLPEQTMENSLVDIVVIGDGEETFRELVTTLESKGDLSTVKGVFYKQKDKVVKNPRRLQFAIDTLGDLAYDLIDVELYKSTPLWTSRKSLPFISSRGCPHRCGYCYNTRFSMKSWRTLSAEQTVESMTKLFTEQRVNGIFLLDDNFFVNLKRVRRICELLKEKQLDIHIYNGNCRADTVVKMDDDLLKLLKEVGFKQLFVGVESGSDEILRKVKKDITTDQVLETNRKLKKAGITAFYSFMAGFPEESMDDVKKTLKLMQRLQRENNDAFIYRLQLFTPFPGTDLYEYAQQLGMHFPDSFEEWAYHHYDRLHEEYDSKYNVMSPRHKKFLKNLHLYTSFLDPKLSSDRKPIIRFISNSYSKILAYRINRSWYSFLFELYPLKFLLAVNKFLKKLFLRKRSSFAS